MCIFLAKKKGQRCTNYKMKKGCNSKIMQAFTSHRTTQLPPHAVVMTMFHCHLWLVCLHRKYTKYSPQQRVDVSLILLNIFLIKKNEQCNEIYFCMRLYGTNNKFKLTSNQTQVYWCENNLNIVFEFKGHFLALNLASITISSAMNFELHAFKIM